MVLATTPGAYFAFVFGLYLEAFVSRPDQPRNQSVDRLRAFAILAVLMLHAAILGMLGGWPLNLPFISTAIGNGNYGVTVFLTASGYLITSVSLRRWPALDRSFVPQFYIFRLARVAPPLVLLVVVLLALSLTGLPQFTPPSNISIGEGVWYVLTFGYDALLGKNNVQGMGAWSPIWSLSVEEQFYLIFPLVACAIRPSRVVVMILILIVLAGPLNHFNLYSLRGSADALALGCLTAIAAPRINVGPIGCVALVCLGCVGLALAFGTMPILSTGYLGASVASWSAACILLASARETVAPAGTLWQRLLWLPDSMIRGIGRSSYELYLCHFPVMLAFSATPFNSVFRLTLSLVVSLVLAALIARFYSEPLNRAIRRWASGQPTFVAKPEYTLSP